MLQYNNKNVLECLKELVDKLNDSHDKVIDLTSLKETLNNIINSITPQNVIVSKEQLINQIKEYQNKIYLEENNIKNNNKSKYDINMINDALNMLKTFENKIYLIIDINELTNLQAEFENEIIKYFS